MIPIARQAQRLRRWLAVSLLSAAGCVHSQPVTGPATNDPWRALPAILARLTPPPFPARDFAVTDFGAKGDGLTSCTQAFRDAIAACNAQIGSVSATPSPKISEPSSQRESAKERSRS